MLLICYHYCDQLKKRFMLVPYDLYIAYDNFYEYLEKNGYGLVCIEWAHFIDINNITLFDNLSKEIIAFNSIDIEELFL